MIEKTLLDYLTKKMSVPVYMETPETAPVEYVIIEKTSGTRANHIDHSTFAIQSYAGSLYRAAEINDEVIGSMLDAAQEDEIGKVSLNTNYNFTDTATKQYRYQAVFDITHY